MIDGFKCSCLGLASSLWKKNKQLEFILPVSESTGEVIRRKAEAKYKGLTFVISPTSSGNETCSMSGSLHKFKNNGVHNYDDFSFPEILASLDELETRFDIKLCNTHLYNLEIGFNLSCKPQHIIKSAICCKNVAFEPLISGLRHLGKVCIFDDYEIKLYDKSKQFPVVKEPVLRVELKIKRSRLLCDCGIETLADLKKIECIKNLVSLLIDKLTNCIFFDFQFKPSGITQKQLLIWQRYSNPNYWEDLNRKLRYKAKTRYTELVTKYGAKDYGVILVGLIREKSKELLQSKRKKGGRFPQIAEDKKAYEKATFSKLEYMSENVPPNSKNTPEPMEEENKGKNLNKHRYCKCCGRDITHQRNGSIFCSEKYFGKEAKKCRNKDSNRRMIIKRKIKNAMEKDKMLQVVYIDSEGVEYSDILAARELNVTREWLERVVSVTVLNEPEKETKTGTAAREYVEALSNEDKKYISE